MISPHLHFGEISIRQLWCLIEEEKRKHRNPDALNSINTYLKELGWREFAHHVLFHFPYTSDKALHSQFNSFPWSHDETLLKRWQKGETGYPIVDAGMRQLWHTGWMHNRVRMIVASFLAKDLLISWYEGARWFWDTLVDADLASNTLGWQWASGCGADAAPYFRIFNPVLQGEKFDQDGNYVRKWVPELANLNSRWIHKPWLAPADALAAARLVPGKTYPAPIIDHSFARQRALEAFSQIKNTTSSAR
jgi:deoxyribodipyrimidine photo-lyase